MSDESAILATVRTMTDAFARGDVDTVMSTYGKPAAVVAAPGKAVTGEAELRGMFRDFIAAGVNFTYGPHEVIVSGNTALHLMEWEAMGPDGTMKRSLSVAVLEKQSDSTWKMVIDHPFGDGVMSSE